MNDSIPDLEIQRIDDGIGEGLIMLKQDGGGNTDTVAIHPIHLRFMAEKFGLIQSSDPQALRTIATQKRRLLLLRDRIESLADWMARFSDHDHADLSYEMTSINALADLSREWCADFEDGEPATEPPVADMESSAAHLAQASLI